MLETLAQTKKGINVDMRVKIWKEFMQIKNIFVWNPWYVLVNMMNI